ncbi:HDOD domain-containing protein [Psychrosphaera sp.]|nr:HDOD domain-containing protein [Psychrosphaera sp.]
MDSSAAKLKQIVQARFIDLMVSDQVAKQRLGLIKEVEESTNNRELLSIEANALEQKERKSKTEEEFKIYINEYFHDALFEYIDSKMSDPEYLFSEVLKLDPNLSKIIDICLSKAVNTKQLAELIEPNTSIKREFLNIINKPPFREKESTKPFQEDVSLAIRYLGIDNIKSPILALIAKQWLPHSTEPFTNFKPKLWQYSIATANCMEALASKTKVNPLQAFTLGLLHSFGYGMIMRMYLRSFEKIRLEEMYKARTSGRSDIEKVLNSLALDGKFASELILEHGLQASYLLLEHLQLKFSPLASVMQEVVDNIALEDMTPMASLLVKSKTYSQYKLLQKARLIELPEAKRFLTGSKINNEFISLLNTVNLSKLNLTNKTTN